MFHQKPKSNIAQSTSEDSQSPRHPITPSPSHPLRRASVLILVVALLVLMALIGTAYISTTRIERYTANQNSANTQADLLFQGLVTIVKASVAGGSQFNPPSQEMPLPAPVQTSISAAFDSPGSDVFLADRIPVFSSGPLAPPAPSPTIAWGGITWPLVTDSTGNYLFDSPFDASGNMAFAANKSIIQCFATTKSENGKTYPGLFFYIPFDATNPHMYQSSSGSIPITAPLYYAFSPSPGWTTIAPTSATISNYVTVGADADGDGIVDSGLWKLPVGPIDNITYYAAVRVVDNNAAINASTAWTATTDPDAAANGAIPANTNFGFFRSNIGLQELLTPGTSDANAIAEMNALNQYRVNAITSATPGAAATFPPASPTTPNPPLSDPIISPPTPSTDESANFKFYSWGDALENQLARRPGNTGYNVANQKFEWLGNAETATMAYRFCLRNPSFSPSLLEQFLPVDVFTTISPSTPYSVSNIGTTNQPNTWFGDLFDFQPNQGSPTPLTNLQTPLLAPKPLRSLLVGSNAVSNAVPSRYGNSSSATIPTWLAGSTYLFGDWVKGSDSRSYICIQTSAATTDPTINATGITGLYENNFWAQAPWTNLPVKTSINTASFAQLWLGFWQVMSDSRAVAPALTEAQPPYLPTAPAAGAEPQLPMFRSVLRDPTNTTRLTPVQMLQLRSAIAAVNAQDLRDSDHDVTSHHIVLTTAAGVPQYDVEIYGTERQPFISEMVADTSGGGTPTVYMAIELCNPYPTALTLNNWQIAILDRTAYPTLSLSAGIPISAAPVIIPAASAGTPGMVVLEDSTVTRPAGVTVAATATVIQVPGLSAALGKELILMRPRLADIPTGSPTANLSKSADPTDVYDETLSTTTSSIDLVPADQLDLTGLGGPTVTAPTRYLYRRGSDGTIASTPSAAWNCCYPGPYDPAQTPSRYQNAAHTINAIVIKSPPAATDIGNLGLADGNNANPDTAVTYPTIALQLANDGMAGMNVMDGSAGGPPYIAPFGTFARNVDMLQIPFIGAYRITNYVAGYGGPTATTPPALGTLVELNSVTMDSALANDTTLPVTCLPSSADTYNTSILKEQLGRFCPVGDPVAGTFDFNDDPAAGPPNWHYHWAKKLLNYFTVQSPQDDYFPNVDPTPANTLVSPNIPAKYPPTSFGAPAGPPQPVANSNPSVANTVTAGQSEDTVGVEGLININTAPWPVLATLPFVPRTGAGTDNLKYNSSTQTLTLSAGDGDDNINLAQAIADYRSTHGPFKTIYDLYKVPAFRSENDLLLNAGDPSSPQGDFSPPPNLAQADGVRFDFKERFLLLNRISNLITTRSDSYTCYVLLQGWRSAGTASASLAVQRRAAFILDRTPVTSRSGTPNTYNILSN